MSISQAAYAFSISEDTDEKKVIFDCEEGTALTTLGRVRRYIKGVMGRSIDNELRFGNSIIFKTSTLDESINEYIEESDVVVKDEFIDMDKLLLSYGI